MMFKIKSDVFFQFPNGFSQDKDKDKADIDFQFPNGFSLGVSTTGTGIHG